METSDLERNPGPPQQASAVDKPKVESDVYLRLKSGSATLGDLIGAQHRYHEYRRWSVTAMMERVDAANLSDADKRFIWNAGRAELTTKPGADRLTRLSDMECRKWVGVDDHLAAAMQACGTWSRYWNEEESHHETAFNFFLGHALQLNRPDDSTIIEFRKIFPDDDMLRTLTLLAMSEIAAAVQYNEFGLRCSDSGLRALLLQISADEIQHMEYFTAFAKALLDSGRYGLKGAIGTVYLFTRTGGEFEAAVRNVTEKRSTHVNWWDAVEGDSDVSLSYGLEKKKKMACKVLSKMSGMRIGTPEALEDKWFEVVGA